MSTAIVFSRAIIGMSAPEVTIEVHLSPGLPAFNIVGLPEKAVKESRDRVRSALMNNDFDMPSKRITVNLAPADLPKQGGRYDLPIAIGLLVAAGVMSQKSVEQYELIGELGLLGEIRACSGVLPIAVACQQARRQLILPVGNTAEAGLVKNSRLIPATDLLSIVSHLKSLSVISPYQVKEIHLTSHEPCDYDLQNVAGHEAAKRALWVAAVGGHSVLMQGPPGSGKSMLAKCFPGMLPPLDVDEAIQTAILYSISTQGMQQYRWRQRPFRSPHHSASAVAIVGGGSPPQPGEISLAHHGVLFLDELLEFSRPVLEALREPMENGDISISRAGFQQRFPSRFQLIAAMNPCPCGYLTDQDRRCDCTVEQVNRYRAKLSGPILDRIDIHVEVPRQSMRSMLVECTVNQSTLQLKQLVMQARQVQLQRQGKLNSLLDSQELHQPIWLGKKEQNYLINCIDRLSLSARSYYKILRVARSLADMLMCKSVTTDLISEALIWRDLKGFD